MRLTSQLLLIGGATAFVATTHPTPFASTSNVVLFSEPSDTSTDDTDFAYDSAIDTDSSDYNPTQEEKMVSDVLNMMPSKLGEVNEDLRSAINEALYKMERLNPTEDAAISPLLNGIWDLRYVGGYSPDGAVASPTRDVALFVYSGGYSPGIFALTLAQKLPSNLVDVGDLEIAISREQPRVEASIPVKFLGGTESKVQVQAAMETKSGMRLRETYESATVMGNKVEIPQPLRYARDMYITYLDEDLLVVRDASGVPEVLVRKGRATTTSGFDADSPSDTSG